MTSLWRGDESFETSSPSDLCSLWTKLTRECWRPDWSTGKSFKFPRRLRTFDFPGAGGQTTRPSITRCHLSVVEYLGQCPSKESLRRRGRLLLRTLRARDNSSLEIHESRLYALFRTTTSPLRVLQVFLLSLVHRWEAGMPENDIGVEHNSRNSGRTAT